MAKSDLLTKVKAPELGPDCCMESHFTFTELISRTKGLLRPAERSGHVGSG
jgi:hypothetical protein